ncbi:MAG: MliC family protein [Halioglobus sp.]
MTRRYGLLLCLALTACAGDAARRGDEAAGMPADSGATLVYQCNDYRFVARPAADAIALWLDDGYTVLPRVPGASGTLYEEGDVAFWSKGDETILTVAGESFQNCHPDPARAPWEDARLRGVDFRGAGDSPAWYLEIQGERQLLFVAGEGMQRVLLTDPVAQAVGAGRIYQGMAGGHALRVEIVDERCTGVPGADTFPSRVVVTLDGVGYRGCGERLLNPWEDLE